MDVLTVSVLPTALLCCTLCQEWRRCWEQQGVSLSTVCDGMQGTAGGGRKNFSNPPPSFVCLHRAGCVNQRAATTRQERMWSLWLSHGCQAPHNIHLCCRERAPVLGRKHQLPPQEGRIL